MRVFGVICGFDLLHPLPNLGFFHSSSLISHNTDHPVCIDPQSVSNQQNPFSVCRVVHLSYSLFSNLLLVIQSAKKMRMPSGELLDTMDLMTFWMLNVCSAFMLSAAHNVLFFVLDWRTPVLHFLHFASALVFLGVKAAASPDRAVLGRLPLAFLSTGSSPLRRLFAPPVAAQLLVCALSARVHAQNRAGALYLVRIFDFLGTLVVLQFSRDDNTQRRRAICILLVPLAMSASLSWLEFSHIEYDAWALGLAPLLALASGLHLVLLKRAQLAFFAAFQQPATSATATTNPSGCAHCQQQSSTLTFPDPDRLFQRFSLCYTMAMTFLLAGPALLSWAQSVVPYDASWESIDTMLIGTSVLFMAGYKYSELWLLTKLELHHFCALEHTKFFMASIGQWFLQNMAHATVFAALGKAIFVASGLRYWLRMAEMRPKEKCGAKSSVAAEGFIEKRNNA